MSYRASRILVVLGLALVAAPARANEADDLFREGVTLLDRGQVKKACQSFEKSQAREPAAGTLLNLAACYERDARFAMALRVFREARAASEARNRADWVRMATEHIDRLTERVGHLTIDTSLVGDVSGLELSLDGHRLTRAELAERPLIVDPGGHTLQATAPGRLPATYSFVAPPAATVHVAPLNATADGGSSSPPPPPPPHEPTSSTSWRKPTGLVVGGVGVAGLAFGGIAALVASSALGDAKAACTSYPDHCSSGAEEPNQRAQSWSTAAAVGLVSGAALTAIGVTLFVWPSSRPTTTARVTVAPDGRATLIVPW